MILILLSVISVDSSLDGPLSSAAHSASVRAYSCLTFSNPMDCSPPDSSVRGIFQAVVLEWVPFSFSKGSSQPWNRTCVSFTSYIGRQILYHCATWEAPYVTQRFYLLGDRVQ